MTKLTTKKQSLLDDTRGAELIEKLVVIALFIFIAAVGLKFLGDKTSGKLESQGQAVENANDTLPE